MTRITARTAMPRPRVTRPRLEVYSPLPERPRRARPKAPSWLTSACVHALILAAVYFGIQNFGQTGLRGEADSGAGIVTILDGQGAAGDLASAAAETALEPPGGTEITFATSDIPSSAPTSEDIPPVPLAEVAGSGLPPVAGPGAAAPSFAATSSAVGPSTGGAATTGGGGDGSADGAAGLARGETGFFGIRDKGESFVYVLDASGSMETNHAIQAAKAELMASLARLHNGQKFQVIFYNERPTPLRLPGRAPAKLYDATDLNRTLARQVISAVQADLGTKHLPALKAALEVQPDVIYFLTDADDPALSARDLDEIRRFNAGARIHAVEFGQGPKLDASTALERLAQQNHGAYQYVDVQKFAR